MTSHEGSRTTTVVLAVLAWLVAATALGATGVLRALRPPAPQVVLLGLTVLAVVLGLARPTLRTWLMTVDERLLVGFHLTRFVGVYFLVLYGRGELPFDFSVPGGWGDIAVATLALGLIVGWRATRVSADGGPTRSGTSSGSSTSPSSWRPQRSSPSRRRTRCRHSSVCP